jgi:hypothetical protein
VLDVGGQNIGLHNLGVIYHDRSVVDRQFQVLAIDRAGWPSTFPCFGLEKRLDRPRRKLAEGFIGWSKDGKGSFGFQGVS